MFCMPVSDLIVKIHQVVPACSNLPFILLRKLCLQEYFFKLEKKKPTLFHALAATLKEPTFFKQASLYTP